MKNKKFWALLLILVAIFFTNIKNHSVSALTDNTISVDPTILNISLPPGKNSNASTNFTITNHYSVPITLNIDLKNIDEQSGRLIPSGDLDTSFSNSIKLSQTQVKVDSGQKQTIKVQINDNGSLKPGGHYAAVTISQDASGSKGTSIRSELSLGLFVVKEEGSNRSLKLSDVSLNRVLFDFPSSSSVELLNDGNVQVVPRGYIRIYDQSNVYYESVFNKQSQITLPGGKYKESFKDLSSKPNLVPKKIYLEVGYRPESSNQSKIYKISFWYVPFFYLIIASVLLILKISIVLMYNLGFRIKKHGKRIKIIKKQKTM